MPKPTKINFKPKNKKVIVFDLDETLGSFGELGSFCNALDEYYGDKQISYNMFNDLLDLYPEFIRPQIINILKYILQKKKEDKCKYIMIYTNNQDRMLLKSTGGFLNSIAPHKKKRWMTFFDVLNSHAILKSVS